MSASLVAPDPVFDYMTGQMRASQPALLAAFEREGAEAVAALQPTLDMPYGPHPRQRFDLFRAWKPAGTLAYFHAGYWQSRDKAQFRCIAPAFVAAGLDVALVNYPLCPEMTLEALTEAVRCAIPAILARPGTAPAGLIAAGHSAGAHLAVELALTDWTARGLTTGAVSGIVALSGIYDLEPLLDTPLNEKLKLDRIAAAAASPLGRVRGGMPPGLFGVGGSETAAFQAQTARMQAAWVAAGNIGTLMTIDGADHFSLLRSLAEPGGAVFKAVMALVRGPAEGRTRAAAVCRNQERTAIDEPVASGRDAAPGGL